MANQNPTPGQPGHAGDPGHQGQGQGQATAPGQNKPPQAQPKSPTELQQEQQQQADEARRNYDEAVEKMTDRNLFDRVRAAHPHAATSREATDQMVKDYERLKEEADKAKGDKSRPMGTTG